MARVESTPPSPPTTRVDLNGANWRLSLEVTVPTGPTRLQQLLPLARALADGIVQATTAALAREGQPVSCGKGCAACCRHLVMISEAEARWFHGAVSSLPEPQRGKVRARFDEARRHLDRAGLLEALRHPETWTPASYEALALAYFRQGHPCPFLEDEACSIHPVRPMRCRQFLATSPAACCADPTNPALRLVALPLSMARALARFHGASAGPYAESYVPLVLALEWAEGHPEEPAPRTGSEWLRQLVNNLGEPGGEKIE